MGSGMAQNLLNAGHDVTLYNRTRSKAEQHQSANAKVADSPRQAAIGAEVVITMLSDDSAVEKVVFGEDGVLGSLSAGAVHVSMSTISVALSKHLAKAHGENRQNYVAAPVFGRPEAAAAAKLFIVTAGEQNQIERCQPLFDLMGQKTFVAGPEAQMANVVKLCGNFMITCVIESLAESFALVTKSGMDPMQFLEIITGSLFNAPIYKTYGAIVAQQKFQPAGFRLPLGLKDNRLVRAAAADVAVPMPLASMVNDLFLTAIAQGMSDWDWSAIAGVTLKNAGLGNNSR